MRENLSAYHESLYQWVWENLEFDVRELQTTGGSPVEIIEQGEINNGAGPDFLNAHIRINGLDWYGSIEIHKEARDWNRHEHQYDKSFNNVVLHVVFKNPKTVVYTENGSLLPTINLLPYLQKDLRKLLSRKNEGVLSCGNKISFINQQAFEKQVKKAHKEYFDYKTSELLKYYDPSLPASDAWRRCFLVQLYNCMGIPRNRKQMEFLAREILSDPARFKTIKGFVDFAMDKAFNGGLGIAWEKTGMRPASRPVKRVKQAAALHASFQNITMQSFLRNGVQVWGKIIEGVKPEYRPGKARLSIVKQTVFLPSLYFLGDLYHSRSIQKNSFDEWKSSHQNVPAEIIKPFREAGFNVGKNVKVLGLAHQYKRYCRKNQCHKCNVFKNAIRS